MGKARIRKASGYPKRTRGLSKSEIQRPSTSRSSSLGQSDSSSVHELVDRPGKVEVVPDKGADGDRDNIWGGILVNSETVVNSDSKSDYSNDSKHLGLGMRVAVGTAKQEDTFVDELFEVTRQRFMSPRLGY